MSARASSEPLAASEIRGRLYNRLKKAPEANLKQNAPIPQNEGSERTAVALAKQHGVSRATIERDGQFAEAVEDLKPFVPDIQERVMRDDTSHRADVVTPV